MPKLKNLLAKPPNGAQFPEGKVPSFHDCIYKMTFDMLNAKTHTQIFYVQCVSDDMQWTLVNFDVKDDVTGPC